MTAFIPSTNKVLGNLRTISALTEDGERPVLSVIAADKEKVFDVDRMTSNVLNVLNGGKPEENLKCSGLRVGWERQDNAIGFHIQKDSSLASKGGLSFVFVQGCPKELVDEIREKLTEDCNVKALCDAVYVQELAVNKQPAPSQKL